MLWHKSQCSTECHASHQNRWHNAEFSPPSASWEMPEPVFAFINVGKFGVLFFFFFFVGWWGGRGSVFFICLIFWMQLSTLLLWIWYKSRSSPYSCSAPSRKKISNLNKTKQTNKNMNKAKQKTNKQKPLHFLYFPPLHWSR